MTRKHWYAKFRKAGYRPIDAWRDAGIVAEFEQLERDYEIRIIAEPEHNAYFDVYGRPQGYTDANGRWVSPEEERAEISRLIDRDGCWIVCAQVKNDDDEWETVDSVGMCVGYSDPCDPLENCYVPDLMLACIGACDMVGAHI